MAVFPTLTDGSVTPDGWEQTKAFDPTVRSRSEGGYLKTRPRCTRVPKKWRAVYEMVAADKTTLTTFENTVMVGSDVFTWTNPDDGVVYSVRLLEPIKFSPIGSKLKWRAELLLEEV